MKVLKRRAKWRCDEDDGYTVISTGDGSSERAVHKISYKSGNGSRGGYVSVIEVNKFGSGSNSGYVYER